MYVRNFLHLLEVTAAVLGISAEVGITVFTVLVNCLVVVLGVNCADCCEINDDPGGSDVVTMLCLWAARQRRPFFSHFIYSKRNNYIHVSLQSGRFKVNVQARINKRVQNL